MKQPTDDSLTALKAGRVSIVIPAYNRLAYLKEAVAAALNQTYTDIEIIISQNPMANGPDQSIQQWAMALANTNPKVRYYLNDANLGISGNYQACLPRITGEYTIIIGDDDVLLENCVENLGVGMRQQADVIFCNRFLIDQHGKRFFGEHVNLDDGYLLGAGPVADAEKVAWLNLVLLSGASIRTEKLLALGFNPDNNLEDFALFVKLAALESRFYFIDELLVEFRVHLGSSTYSGNGTFHHLLKQIIPIRVRPENQSIKDRFIKELMPAAVNQCLRENNRSLARYLLSSGYYPKGHKMMMAKWIQCFLLLAPPTWTKHVLALRRKKFRKQLKPFKSRSTG
jgi:glycosyltransferase involved in cell wall biosynthesis